MLAVERIGRAAHYGGEKVAVPGGDVLEIELDAGVAIRFALAQKARDHPVLRRCVPEQLVVVLLVHERENGDDLDMRRARRLEHMPVRPARDRALRRHVVPGGHQDVDLVLVLVEGADGGGVVSKVKHGLWLRGGSGRQESEGEQGYEFQGVPLLAKETGEESGSPPVRICTMG